MNPPVLMRLPKSSGWGLFIKTVKARAYPRLVGAFREKSWIFFEIFLPLLAVSAYVFIYRALEAPEEYIGFVVVGGAMTAFLAVLRQRVPTGICQLEASVESILPLIRGSTLETRHAHRSPGPSSEMATLH